MTELPREYFYASLPPCVLDAVFSISTRYGAGKNVVQRYSSEFRVPPFRPRGRALPERSEQHTIREFLDHAERLGPEGLADTLQNRQRTSTTSGILKADAAIRFARVLGNHGVEVLQDVPKVLHDDTFKRDIRQIPASPQA